jgi:hypothetical protein
MLPERFRAAVRMDRNQEEKHVMKTITGLAALGAALFAVAAPSTASAQSYRLEPQVREAEAQLDAAMRRFDAEYDALQRAFDTYRRSRPTGDWRNDRGYNDNSRDTYNDDPNYDPSQYYRSGPNYQERTLGADDRVYRGNDGRYYCRRSDGTTGLIVGAAAGGLFGNIIAGRRSSTVGTLLGAIAGGAAGASIDRNQQQIRCR